MAGATAGAARTRRADAHGRGVVSRHGRSQAHRRRTKEVDRRVERERTEDHGAQEDRREEARAQADRSEEDGRAQARRAEDDDRAEEDGDPQDCVEPCEKADSPTPVDPLDRTQNTPPSRAGCFVRRSDRRR